MGDNKELRENGGCFVGSIVFAWLMCVEIVAETSLAWAIIVSILIVALCTFLLIKQHRLRKEHEESEKKKREKEIRDMERKEAAEESRLLSKKKSRIEKLERCANEHRKELAALRIRLLVKDEFGHVDDQAWRDKVLYFTTKVANVDLGKDFYTDTVIDKNGRLRTVHIDTYILGPDAAFKIVDKIAREAQKEIKNREYRPDMTGIEYEELCGIILKDAGWEVQFTRATGDQGVDILAKKGDIIAAVQCKRFSKPVGNKAVQEVIAGRSYYNANKAVVVAPNGFTPSAQDLAAASDVILTDHNLLGELSI